MKPKPPTRAQLQEKIDNLLKLNAGIKASHDNAWKDSDRLEKQLSSSLHWKEVAVIVAGISLCTFIIGWSIGHKFTKRGEKEVEPATKHHSMEYWRTNHSYHPNVITNPYTNINIFTRPNSVTLITTNGFNGTFSTNESIQFSPTQRIPEAWIFKTAEREKGWQKVVTHKTYRSIVTRKGAELLRR